MSLHPQITAPFGRPLATLAADEPVCSLSMVVAVASILGGTLALATAWAVWAEWRAAAARRRAQEAEDARRGTDDSLADTVHELRTPLTTVIAAVEVLREGYASSSEEREIFYEQAHAAAQHMLFLVHDLLDAAALGAGRLRVDIRDCFVADLLDDAARMLRPAAWARGCTIDLSPLPDCLACRADPHRARQVLFNLLGNALKYSPEGTSVRVAARVIGEDVHVEIVDEGIGVPIEKRHALFGRYSRVHGAHASEAPGTGLGLALCRELMHRMQGAIGYRPRLDGPGSVFWFRLPRATVASPPPAAALTTPPGRAPGRGGRAPARPGPQRAP